MQDTTFRDITFVDTQTKIKYIIAADPPRLAVIKEPFLYMVQEEKDGTISGIKTKNTNRAGSSAIDWRIFEPGSGSLAH